MSHSSVLSHEIRGTDSINSLRASAVNVREALCLPDQRRFSSRLELSSSSAPFAQEPGELFDWYLIHHTGFIVAST